MADELQERLKSHARAFDSLLSLIPAKLYYGEDVSDQWQRKKQTPEQKRAAKMAKLDPDNWKSAKDVMDERAAAALKRKRDDEGDYGSPESNPLMDAGLELPRAAQDTLNRNSKRQKLEPKIEGQVENPNRGVETEEQKRERKAQQKAAKRERKQEAKAKAKAKMERQKAKKKETDQGKRLQNKIDKDELKLNDPIDLGFSATRIAIPVDDQESNDSSSEGDHAEVFSPPQESGTSSTSSILPPAEMATKSITVAMDADLQPKNTASGQTPKERLQAAISQLRAERKADGADGRAPKTRQELLEQRRRKEEERKAAKKEQKRREKEEEARRQDEEIARRFSPGGSGSLLASPRSPMIGDNSSNSSLSNNFSFGRIAFDDGTQLDPSISGVLEEHKRKGPADTASALKAAQVKKTKLSGLDEQKRKEIEQKDLWLNAKRRAHGEHVRDDMSLLKKALKRQQGQKKKSEKEWSERIEGVQKAQEAKQKKRSENLAKRKDEKKSGKGKKVKRPGFEGSFKGRTGGKRKS